MLHSKAVSSVEPGVAAPVTCANHPKVETGVSCSTCGKPICPDCMVPAAVGIKCRECARPPRSARVTLHADKAVRAVLVALGAGTAMGVVLAYVGGFNVGFFTFILAYFVGIAAGRATLWGAGYFRGGSTAWIAAGGAAWAYVISGVVIAASVGGSPKAYVQVVGLLVAAFFAHREVS